MLHRTRWVGVGLVAFVLAFVGPWREGAATADDGEQPKRVDRVVVVHVVVPLCHNAQLDCGSPALGDPDNLRTNIYWGAIFGARRIFEKKWLGYEKVTQATHPEGVLERAVFRRYLERSVADDEEGASERVEHITVLDAIDGNQIDDAVVRFFRAASEGEWITFEEGDASRRLRVDAVGYAGHNRLMDDVKLPALRKRARKPIPSFVLACYSHDYFTAALRDAGSRPLVMTKSLMAPEGYVVEAASRGIAEGDARAALKKRVATAYASYQSISYGTAASVFVNLDANLKT